MTNYEPQVNATLGVADITFPEAALETVIIAQGISGGSYTDGALVEDIGNDPDAGKDLCGAGSEGHLMIQAFKALNKKSRLHAIIVDANGSGVAADATIVFTATPTESGTLYATVGSAVNNRYSLVVTTSSTATTIGADLAAQITADPNSPVTAINTAGSVALTAKTKGTCGNSLTAICDGTIAGVSYTVSAFTSGATDPVITTPLALLDERKVDIIADIAHLAAIKTHLDAKFNVDNAVWDGVGFFAKTDTYANHATALAPATLASINIVRFCDKLVADSLYKGSAIAEIDTVKIAQFAAFASLRSVDNAVISSFMQAGNTRGGANMFAIPYFNMIMLNFPTIRAGKGFSSTEIKALKELGGSTWSNAGDNSSVVTNQVYTSAYKKDTPTQLGYTYKTLCDRNTFGFVRKYVFDNVKIDFAQSKLTNGDATSNNSEVINNAQTIKSAIKGYWMTLSGTDYNLLQRSAEEEASFDETLSVAVDTANGAIAINMNAKRVGQADDFNINITPQL